MKKLFILLMCITMLLTFPVGTFALEQPGNLDTAPEVTFQEPLIQPLEQEAEQAESVENRKEGSTKESSEEISPEELKARIAAEHPVINTMLPAEDQVEM